jgi:hypothetical protein
MVAMEKHDTAIHTARITARQAIVVTVITTLGGIITTLIATGNLFPNRETPTQVASSVPAVLDAPHLYFNWKTVDGSLENCMEKAVTAVKSPGLNLEGRDRRNVFAFGYRQQTTGVIGVTPTSG